MASNVSIEQAEANTKNAIEQLRKLADALEVGRIRMAKMMMGSDGLVFTMDFEGIYAPEMGAKKRKSTVRHG